MKHVAVQCLHIAGQRRNLMLHFSRVEMWVVEVSHASSLMRVWHVQSHYLTIYPVCSSSSPACHSHGEQRIQQNLTCSHEYECHPTPSIEPPIEANTANTVAPCAGANAWQHKITLNKTFRNWVLALFLMTRFPQWNLIDWHNSCYWLFISLLQQWINTSLYPWLN